MSTATPYRELRDGDLIRDNDPRMQHRRTYRVTAIRGNRVQASASLDDEVFIALHRIMTDGKPRRGGWSLVT